MKSISRISCGMLLSAMLACLSTTAMAQAAGKPDATPPKLEKLEEGPDSGITISKPESKNKITEKRSNSGKVTEVHVKSGNSSYVLKADPEVGNAPKGTVQGDANRAAQWTILEFGGKKEGKEVETPPVLPPAPAAPAPASTPAKK
ncbi:MAG: hypothetical protein HYZ65_13720 [Burkholderiales bacterium]|nr:hypothetical protein [Burkholderiales bacterium]